jgi:hypothetical protein
MGIRRACEEKNGRVRAGKRHVWERKIKRMLAFGGWKGGAA